MHVIVNRPASGSRNFIVRMTRWVVQESVTEQPIVEAYSTNSSGDPLPPPQSGLEGLSPSLITTADLFRRTPSAKTWL
jgi:hypothetical protein